MLKIGILLFVYSIAYLIFRKQKAWDIFTRIISTINALKCIEMVSKNMINLSMFDLYYVASDSSLDALFWFSSYLLIDGVFMSFDFQLTPNMVLSLIHHFVGSFGIYLIAETKMGFFLGFYFAMTELSTPILNLSWLYREPKIFKIFYILFFFCRILTIPILLYYLHKNTNNLYTLRPLYSFMSFYASYTLIFLNNFWFIFLSKKYIALTRKIEE